MILRRISVGSAAKVSGVMYAIFGLIVGAIVALISMVSAGLLAGAQNEDIPSWFGAAFGVGAIVIFPVLYGVMGVVIGAIAAGVYNLVAGMVGGLDLEVEQSGPAMTTSR